MTIFLTLAVVVLTIASGMSIFACVRLFKKNIVLEQWMIDTLQQVEYSYLLMKQIDERGLFEKDDDVGVTFTALKDTMDSLYQKIELPGEQNEPKRITQQRQ